MSLHWRKQPERGSLFLIRAILWCALHLGRRFTRIFLYPITGYFLLAAPKPRQASRKFLSRVLGEKIGLFKVARHIHCFSASILDRVFLLVGKVDQFDTTIYGEDVLLQKFHAGQGCLLFGSHLGSFEILRSMANAEQLPVKVLMYKDQTEKITKVLDTLNPEIANSVIPLGQQNTMLIANEFVQDGGILGLLSDRAGTDDKLTEVDFMGAKARFPAGPLILASAMKVPVILIFGLYRGGNRYDIHFELFAEQIQLSRKGRAEDIQRWMQKYAGRLEYYARKAPYNWFNFYDFWAKTN